MEKEYYKTDSKTMPVRWCAPEVLEYGKFSTQSDVWAFGVVLWEMFSYGKVGGGGLQCFHSPMLIDSCIWQIPYTGMSNAEVTEKVVGGYRMPSPDQCPKQIYEWMLACWKVEPEQRPSFKQLYDEIEKIWLDTRQNQLSSSSTIPSEVKQSNVQPQFSSSIPSEMYQSDEVQSSLTVDYNV